jgi:uncharacterized membrane protein YoaK (UPF0700 family)
MSPLIASNPRTDKVLVGALIAMTAATGVVDAVSFLSLGRIFAANMTGNVVILAFATAGAPGLSVRRSGTALVLFLVGAVLGGRIMSRASADSQIRFATLAFALETAFLLTATLCAIGYRGDLLEDSFQPFALIALTALAMGTRNAAVRKLAIPDLTTTVLTLTITGLGADSSLAEGGNPRWQRRVASVLAMFGGAALGAIVVRHTVLGALALAAGLSAVSSAALLSSTLWIRTAQAPIRGN